MNARQRKTLEAILARPERGDIRWAEVESLLQALGCRKLEGDGSRVRFVAPDGLILRLHRPHPNPGMDKGAVKSLRRFLHEMGVDT